MAKQSRARRGPRRALAVMATIGVLVVAACGSSTKTNSSTATTKAAGTATTKAGGTATSAAATAGATTVAAGGDGKAKAKALVDQYSKRPTSIGLKTPVGKAIPAGKKLYFVSCGVEICELEFDVVKQATDILG